MSRWVDDRPKSALTEPISHGDTSVPLKYLILIFAGSNQIIVGEQTPVEEILDTIGDNHARRILAAVSRESRPAKEIAEACDISLPTVYRRLELLAEHDLVTDYTKVDEHGNEFRIYECNFESTVISLEDDEYEVRIYRTENLPDRFSRLWDDLRPPERVTVGSSGR